MSASRAVCGPGKLLATSERVVGKAIGNRATRPPTRVQLPTLRPSCGGVSCPGFPSAPPPSFSPTSKARRFLMSKSVLLLSTLLLGGFLVSAQDSKPATQPQASQPLSAVPIEAARKENPVKATAESLARGKKQYGFDCAM